MMLLQCGSRPTHGERTGGDVISCSRLCVETALKKKKTFYISRRMFGLIQKKSLRNLKTPTEQQ